jgi:glycerophosphoryl diester phosphodiesterase
VAPDPTTHNSAQVAGTVDRYKDGSIRAARVPTLNDALHTAKQCGIHIYIDIKGRSYLEELVADAIVHANAFDYVLVAPLELHQAPPAVQARMRYLLGLKVRRQKCSSGLVH